MKILFIYKYEYVEPLGIMQLSSFLKKHGHKCYFIDLKFETKYMGEIQKISPDIIAYSITTGQHSFYQKVNLKIKKKIKFFSFFGGPHCTFFPEFINKEGVDAICRGEGEFPLLELANNLEKGKNLTKIKNLWVKVYGKVYKNDLRHLIEDLDMLPPPDRALVSKYKHYRNMHGKSVMTGRGCPYKCTYCFNHSYNKLYKGKGRMIRRRSVGNVIEELKSIKENYPTKRFIFIDDIFILDTEWVFDFCEAYKKEIKLPFVAIVRVNLVTDDVMRALKKAGCITVQYGIESGNEWLRNKILKRNITTRQILNASRIINTYGFRVLCYNVLGFPDETLNMAFETLETNIECKPSYAWVSIYQPFPRTELCEYAITRGFFHGDVDAITDSWLDRESSIRIKDIEKMERLRYLFSIGVAFPFLVPLIKGLIKLPLNRLYRLICLAHRSWNYFFKIKLIDLTELFIIE